MNQGFGTERLYKYDGRLIGENAFYQKVMETLEKYKYAESWMVASVMHSDQRDIEIVFTNKIIDYIRRNKGCTVAEVCRALFIRSKYVLDLVRETRVEAEVQHSNELEELTREIAEADVQNKQMHEELLKTRNEMDKMEKLKKMAEMLQSDRDEANRQKPGYHFLHK